MSESNSAKKADATQHTSSKNLPERLLLVQESVEDEYEIDLIDEDEQHTTPLIKEAGNCSAGSKKTSKVKQPMLTIEINDKAATKDKKSDVTGRETKADEEEDDDEEEDVSETTRFKQPPNTPPPITIGKIKIFNPGRRRRALRLRRLIKRCCTLLFTLLFLLFLLYNVNRLPEIARIAFSWLDRTSYQLSSKKDINSKCGSVVSSSVWRQNFPMLTVESALRMMDVNNDTVLDVIVPFGTGIDAAYYDQTLCRIYFNQTENESKTTGCGGGVMAIDGKNGEPIWAQYAPHELFATNCNLDLNLDGQKDCIIGGRMASLYAIDGRKGTILWSINSNYGEPVAETSNFYTPLLIPKDVDGDSVTDIIVMHGGDPLRKPGERVRNVARLMVISARTGRILSWNYVPDNAESYYSPQLLVHPDGTLLVMFGTGGETHPGGLYVVSLDGLLRGQLDHNYRAIFQDCCKGVISPPVLVDINRDEIVDIVLANFNSTVFAFDGLTFDQLWKREFVDAETYSSPAVGLFNDDDVPDFGVTYQFGPGFPIYYYAQFNVIDGRNGELLLKEPIRMPIGTQSSPLTVSTFAQNDIFLFWYSSCSNSTPGQWSNQSTELTDNGPFQISPGATVHESSRADFCRLRFGEKAQQYSQYRAITMDSSVTIYDSRTDEPNVKKRNYTQIAYRWYESRFGPISAADSAGRIDETAARTEDEATNDGRNPAWGAVEQNLLGLNTFGRPIKDDSVIYSPDAYEQLKKYKKWSAPQIDPSGGQFDSNLDNLVFNNQQGPIMGQDKRRKKRTSPQLGRHRSKRVKRHVGLHNGDSVQRVISTGTLAPSLSKANSVDQLQVDGSIDVLFATYSFPPSSNVKLMSEAIRNCIQAYMTPEKEAELRLMDDNSQFKRLGYDHDAYEAAVKDLCSKEHADTAPQAEQQPSEQSDLLRKNEWLREMGSMTVHRVNLKCFDHKRQVAIKEYRYQWWPSYLGILADAVANLIE